MLKKNSIPSLRRLIVFVLLAVPFVWTSGIAFASENVVIFSGQSVVDHTVKGTALQDSHKTPLGGGGSVRIEFRRPKLEIVVGPKPGTDVFSPSRIDWSSQNLVFDYRTIGLTKILSFKILIPVGGYFLEAVALQNSPDLMNLKIDGQWHTAVVNVRGWQKVFQAALDAKQITEGALVAARIGIKVAHNGAINIANLRAVPKQGAPSPEATPSPSPSPTPEAKSTPEVPPRAVVFFSGQSVVEHTGKGNAFQSSAEVGKLHPMPPSAPPRGYLDSIQLTRHSLRAQGWAGSYDSANPVIGIVLYVRDIEGVSLVDLEIYNGGFEKTPRPDVAEFLKSPDWMESGFIIQSEISPPLKPGVYEIWPAAVLKNGKRFALDHMIAPMNVKRFSEDSIAYKIAPFLKGNFFAIRIPWLAVLTILIVGCLIMYAFLKIRSKLSGLAIISFRRDEESITSWEFSQNRLVIDDEIDHDMRFGEAVVHKPNTEPMLSIPVSIEGALGASCLRADVRLKSIRKEMSRIFEKGRKHILNNSLPFIGLDKNKKILILPEQSANLGWLFIGNICGDFFALYHLLEKAKENPNFRICFLGDLISGSRYDLECFALFLQTAMENPDQILWIAGDNDEALDFNADALRKFSSKLELGLFVDVLNAPDGKQNCDNVESWRRLFNAVVADLPRAVLFPDGLLATHGDIPLDEMLPGLKSLDDLNSPLVLRDFYGGLYSIMTRKREDKVLLQATDRHMNSYFDQRDLEQFCNDLGWFCPVKGLIRSHDHVDNGWQKSTVFRNFSILTINGFGFDISKESYEEYSEGLVLGIYRNNEAPDFEYVTYDEAELAAFIDKKRPSSLSEFND